MRLFCRPFLFSLSLFFCLSAISSTSPPDSAGTLPSADFYKKISSMKVRDVQKLTGRRMTLRERFAFGVLKHTMKKKEPGSPQGKTSLVFGIAGLALLVAGLFIPYVILAALAASILAIVMGSDALKKEPADRKASSGRLLGWITLGLICVILILVLIYVAS